MERLFIKIFRGVCYTLKRNFMLSILLTGLVVLFSAQTTYAVDVMGVPENSGSLSAQQNSISGVVTDRNGLPLPGVSIVIKGTVSGTVTDVTGRYTLSNVPRNAVLVFSFVGMKGQEVTAEGRSVINVTLEEETIGIEEVVAVGYGTQKKVNVTGSVDVISQEKLAGRTASTVSQLLMGTSPGLEVSTTSVAGFEPGAEMSLDIRGIGSLNGGSPYILIDGIEGDLDRLNPEDIESISVLKDAASSAIYGARAPYGVILITTKNGTKQEKMNISYTGSAFLKTTPPLPNTVSGLDWMRIVNESGRNRGGQYFNNARVDRAIAYEKQDWDFIRNSFPEGTFAAWPEGANVFGASPDLKDQWGWGYGNMDWFDDYYKTSVNHKHQFNIKGGSDKIAYYFSTGYLYEDNCLTYPEDWFQRINLLGKIDFSITDWWTLSWNSRYSRSTRTKPNNRSGAYEDMFYQFARMYPATPKYDGWGNYLNESYIPAMKDGGSDITWRNETMNIFSTEFRPLKGWSIHADVAYESDVYVRTDEEKITYKYTVKENVKTIDPNSQPNSIARYHYNGSYLTANLYSKYSFSDRQNNHNFSIMAGGQYEKGGPNYYMTGLKYNVISEDVYSFQTASGDYLLSETLNHMSTEGFFARLNYNYKEKYLFESNARYDGSYVFRRGNRWGFFPSFSLGWNVHKESFWSVPENIISSLKLRGSWGELGNMNISPYSDLELITLNTGKLNWIYGFGNTRTVGYTSAPSIVNKELTWETAGTTNLGIDVAFLNNKLQATFDVFERMTTGMVGPSEARPGVLGAAVPKDNNATLRTRGWDLTLNWHQGLKNGLNYFVNLNLFDNTSVVTKYNNPTKTLSTWYEGKEVGEIWGYTVNDLFRTTEELDSYRQNVDLKFISTTWRTGDIRIEDINDDKKIDNGKNTKDDPGDQSIIGNSTPHYQFGIQAGIDFKGFDFSMLWKGVAKQDVYFDQNAQIYWGILYPFYNNCFQERNTDYFRDEPGTQWVGLIEGDANINLDAFWPRPYHNQTDDWKNKRYATTRYLGDKKYIRLQNLQFGYTLPQSVVARLHLEKLRIFFSGDNMFTFTPLPDGLDPVASVGQGGYEGRVTNMAYRTYALGLNINF